MQMDDSYLETHIKQLTQTPHNLAQITITHPHNPNERPGYTKYINYLKGLKHLNGTPLVVIDCDNIGRSYGQWSRVYDRYRDNFDYYLLIEDDYLPWSPYFDAILVEIFKEKLLKTNCGYLCGKVWGKNRFLPGESDAIHAAVANGLVSSKALKDVWKHFGELPHDKEEYSAGQLIFSDAFYEVGYTIEDYTDKYKCMYWSSSERAIVVFGNPHDMNILMPVQWINGTNFNFA
jgi:hypothetical protein